MENKCTNGQPLTRNEPCEYCGAKFGETCGYQLQKLLEQQTVERAKEPKQ
jgi:biotin synthase-like enzyme